ncbi:hypothetical protein VTK73DRAFT_6539 [Phialemonium thermophilum]|uniref:Uncharacterized protein n=1 Tax=Phialemonium thermophilum TaxID=223376 RepID=A0ABR3XW56_9PEZI
MSQVKNLRAMFEQKGDTSPPDRGRSTGVVAPTPSDSPRPLSKVRTNFIAVEKDGRIGLTRDPSRDSNASGSTRKLSGELEGGSPPSAIQQESHSLVKNINRTAPTMDNKMETETSAKNTDLGAKEEKASAEGPAAVKAEGIPLHPKKKSEAEGDNLKKTHDASTDKRSAGHSGSIRPNGSSAEHVNGIGAKSRDNGLSKGSSSITAAGGPAKAATRTTPAGAAAAKPSTKTTNPPITAKAPKSPAAAASSHPVKTPEKKTSHPERSDAPKAAAHTTKTSNSSAKKPAPLKQASPPSAGFVKPKVKSPTRPVKLPPSLTTHTAASVSKVNAPRQSLSRGSGTFSANDHLGRSPSRASISTVGTTRAAGTIDKGLKRQRSTISRPRPSIGPPPKQPAKDHPPTKKEREVDEGFLARMMRPTQASSSKTAEKVPATPPKKTSGAQAATKKIAQRQEVKPVARKTVAKVPAEHARPATTASKAAASKPAPTKPATSQKDVSPAVVHDAVAKEVDGTADSSSVADGATAAQEEVASVGHAGEPVEEANDAKDVDIPASAPTGTSEAADASDLSTEKAQEAAEAEKAVASGDGAPTEEVQKEGEEISAEQPAQQSPSEGSIKRETENESAGISETQDPRPVEATDQPVEGNNSPDAVKNVKLPEEEAGTAEQAPETDKLEPEAGQEIVEGLESKTENGLENATKEAEVTA